MANFQKRILTWHFFTGQKKRYLSQALSFVPSYLVKKFKFKLPFNIYGEIEI